jgi:molybdopterin-guanine dinucleotide biosynthesis protein B/molybdopterin-guanine dinucleotide biosynthesis protein
MTSHPNDTVRIGVLIAGGSARRAGVDKRFLVLGGRALLLRNIAFLRAAFPTVAVSLGAGQTLDLGDAGDTEVVHDAWPGASPLAGIASALARYRQPVFALAADITFPDREAIRRVLTAFPGHDLALPAIGREYHQPLFAVYGPACLAPMTALLEAGRHRIVEILPSLDAAEVRFPDDALFHNINTMDDYQEARRRAAAGGDAPAGGAAAQPALVAIVGKSDAGKTTLIEKVVPELVKLGLRVGTVKHDAHSFEIDHPGKDSWRHGQAGAHAYAIASPERLAFITKLDGEMPLADIARRFFAGFDLVLAEGYKRTAPHRVELFRVGAGHADPLCGPGEAMALVTDAELHHEHRFGLEDGAGLARFLAVRLDSLRAY